MPSLILDECVSPRVSPRLWEVGVDNYSLRDRALLQMPDYAIWQRAQEEHRTVVTINESDFVKFAERDKRHAGLITFPSGANPDGQYCHIMNGLNWAARNNAIMPSFRNRITCVSVDGVNVIKTALDGGDEEFGQLIHIAGKSTQ